MGDAILIGFAALFFLFVFLQLRNPKPYEIPIARAEPIHPNQALDLDIEPPATSENWDKLTKDICSFQETRKKKESRETMTFRQLLEELQTLNDVQLDSKAVACWVEEDDQMFEISSLEIADIRHPSVERKMPYLCIDEE